MGRIKLKKINAMSLLSLLIVLTMIVVVMAASAPMISQNLTKISKGKKKAGEVGLSDKNGYFLCYYNAQDQLCYKQIELDSSSNVTVTGTNMAEDGTCSGNCIFTIPEAETFEITLVGGGGGGGIPNVKNNFDSVVKQEEIKLEKSATVSTGIFEGYEDFIDDYEKWNILSKIFGDLRVALKGGIGSYVVTCARDFGSEIFNELKKSGKLTFTQENGYNGSLSAKREFYVNGEYKMGYDAESQGCLSQPNPKLCGCDKSNSYSDDIGEDVNIAIQRRRGIDDFSTLMTNKNPLSINLIAFAVDVKDVTAAKPGSVRKYKTSFIADSGTNELIFNSDNIGKGGNGGQIAGGVYTPAENGGQTNVKINKIDMYADGGEGSKLAGNYIPYRLSELTVGKKGENGDKPTFYIPSRLGISEKELAIGLGSNCKAEGCSEINISKYPGSSGASSGYNIGTNNLVLPSNRNLASKNFVRVEINGSDVIYPEGYSKIEGSSYRPNLQVQVTNKAGKGANGAILISW